MEHNNLHLLDHPLVQHKMAFLRDKNTGVKEFRTLIGEVSTLLCLEATRDLPLRPAQVETPIGKADVQMLAGRKLAIVPILRAGLGMVDGILQLVPAAKTGHIGLERDHDTLKPREYYCRRQCFGGHPASESEGSTAPELCVRGGRSGRGGAHHTGASRDSHLLRRPGSGAQ